MFLRTRATDSHGGEAATSRDVLLRRGRNTPTSLSSASHWPNPTGSQKAGTLGDVVHWLVPEHQAGGIGENTQALAPMPAGIQLPEGIPCTWQLVQRPWGRHMLFSMGPSLAALFKS